MKSRPAAALLAFPAAFGLAMLAAAPAAPAEERILSFHSRIVVERDGSIEVTETIRVRSTGQEIRRGIFRDLPTLYEGRWGLRERRPFEVLETTRAGAPEPHAVEAHKAGVRIRIGRADRLLEPGEHLYTLRYRGEGLLLFHESHDEIYWNATGDEWAFPIDEASVEILLPEGIEFASCEGYLGRRGSQERPAAADFLGGHALVAAGRVLRPGEGLTVSATWPPGSLEPAAYERDTAGLVLQNATTLLGLFLLAAMFLWHLLAWIAVGRDPAPGRIIPQFTPPPGYSPAAVRMLSRMRFDNTCFSAAVMNLGVKGVVQIEGDGKHITLHKTGEQADPSLAAGEKALFGKLLGKRSSIELKQSNHATVSAARTALQRALAAQLEKTHFLGNAGYWVPGFLLSLAAVALLLIGRAGGEVLGMVLWLSIWTVGTGALLSSFISQWRGGSRAAAVPLGLFSIPFVIAWVVGMGVFVHLAGTLTAGAFVLAVTVNALFYHWIKAPTHLGRRILDHIEGLKHYLQVAEEDRLAGFAGPERTPELFEALLPYAHALGVEQAWSAKFREVLARAGQAPADGGAYRPRFYTGSHTGMDRAMAAGALGGALTGALTSAATSPSSSGGSGGGGSSGGGRGGGGGGGW